MTKTNERNLQEQVILQIQELDDVYHRAIISLERLELFLNGTDKETKKTALGSERDLHRDSIVFNEEDYFDELAIDCMALLKNSIEDGKLFQDSVSFFVNDILEWYAGREGFDFNEVDAAIIPILVALTQSVKKTRDIDDLFEEYVYKSKPQEYTIEEKYAGTKDMLESLLKGEYENQEKRGSRHESDQLFTKHERGDALEGYRRIYKFLTSKFNTTFPIKVFLKTINEFAPQISNSFPKVTIEAVEDIILNNKQSQNDDNSHTNSATSKLSKDVVYNILIDIVKSKLDELEIPYNNIYINID